MKSFDPVQALIYNVAYSHSESENTGYKYKYFLEAFCEFIGMTPQQIIEEYETARDERTLRRKYARYLQVFVSQMKRRGYCQYCENIRYGDKEFLQIQRHFYGLCSNGTKQSRVPQGYLRRNKDEIQRILEVSRPREKAFFCMMAQSGLRPDTLCNLKLTHPARLQQRTNPL